VKLKPDRTACRAQHGETGTVAESGGRSGEMKVSKLVQLGEFEGGWKTTKPPSHCRRHWLTNAPRLSMWERALLRNIGNGLNVDPIDLHRYCLRN
jgi:hypothetical protein